MGDGYIKQIRAYAANARLLLVLPVVISYVDDGADPPTRNPSSNHPCRIRNVPSFTREHGSGLASVYYKQL